MKGYFLPVPEESVSERSYFTETATLSAAADFGIGEKESVEHDIPEETFENYHKSTTKVIIEKYDVK